LLYHLIQLPIDTASDGVTMSTFQVTVQTSTQLHTYPALAASAGQAAEDAAERFADVPCGITVTSSEVQ
jgi:hypothetical protein